MRITVYVVNYNYGKFIEQCINSLMDQTDQDFDFFVIDNGSQDNSNEIVRSINSNIKIYETPNLKLTQVANFALDKCKGDYIVRLDADDWLHFDYIKKMKEKIRSKPDCAAFFPNYCEVDISGNIQRNIKRFDFDSEVSLLDLPAHGACTIFLKEALINVGMYDESLDRQDGFDIWLKIIKSYKVTNERTMLFYYRKHGNNLTSNIKDLLNVRNNILCEHASRTKYSRSNVLYIIPLKSRIDFFGKIAMHEIDDSTVLERLIHKIRSIDENATIMISTEDESISHPQAYTYLRQDYHALHETHKACMLNAEMKSLKKFSHVCVLHVEYPLMDQIYIESAVSTAFIFDVDSVDSVIVEEATLYKHTGRTLEPVHNSEPTRFERNSLYKKAGGITVIKSNALDEFDGFSTRLNSHIMIDPISALRVESYQLLEMVCKYVQ